MLVYGMELAIFFAAIAAGMINSIAGGGTLLTFPALIWAGHPPIVANATNSFALTPGAWSSFYGYRREVREMPRRFFVLMIPSLLGSLVGAILLRLTPPPTFEFLVPFLILFATGLFTVQGTIQRWLRTGEQVRQSVTWQWMAGASGYQLLVGIYGGYFGAGIGILMLAVLGMMGLENIHQMNGFKNLLGTLVNGTAAVYFVTAGLIEWRAATLMAIGAILGGYGAAGVARRLSQQWVRRIVILIGLGMSFSLLLRL
ncbi:MAG: sulfite exporter TauE/SafE family protein [Blastocatellia bacterium]